MIHKIGWKQIVRDVGWWVVGRVELETCWHELLLSKLDIAKSRFGELEISFTFPQTQWALLRSPPSSQAASSHRNMVGSPHCNRDAQWVVRWVV